MALSVIGMGDINAVDVAADTHVELLAEHGAMHRPGLLPGDLNFRRRRCCKAYIDDTVVIGVVNIADFEQEGPDSLLAEKCLEALQTEGAEIS